MTWLAEGIRARRWPVIEQYIVEGLLAIGAPHQLERLAGRAHPQPRRQLAAPGEVGDLGVASDQQLDAQGLLHLVHRARRGSRSRRSATSICGTSVASKIASAAESPAASAKAR